MEASDDNVRGIVDSLIKVVDGFDAAGVQLIGKNSASRGGARGGRLKLERTS